MKSKFLIQAKFLVALALLAILVQGISSIVDSRKSKIDPQIRYHYSTDTLRVPSISPISHQEDGILTPPKTLYKYIETKVVDSTAIKQVRDSLTLIINGLQSQIWINTEYLKRYPRCHKLIGFTLDTDSLNLDLLSIKGDVFTESYPLDFTHFDYYYSNNKFFRSTRSSSNLAKQSHRKSGFTGYIGSGYGILDSQPIITAGVRLPVFSFEISAESRFGLLDYNKNSLDITLRKTLWQRK